MVHGVMRFGCEDNTTLRLEHISDGLHDRSLVVTAGFQLIAGRSIALMLTYHRSPPVRTATVRDCGVRAATPVGQRSSRTRATEHRFTGIVDPARDCLRSRARKRQTVTRR